MSYGKIDADPGAVAALVRRYREAGRKYRGGGNRRDILVEMMALLGRSSSYAYGVLEFGGIEQYCEHVREKNAARKAARERDEPKAEKGKPEKRPFPPSPHDGLIARLSVRYRAAKSGHGTANPERKKLVWELQRASGWSEQYCERVLFHGSRDAASRERSEQRRRAADGRFEAPDDGRPEGMSDVRWRIEKRRRRMVARFGSLAVECLPDPDCL